MRSFVKSIMILIFLLIILSIGLIVLVNYLNEPVGLITEKDALFSIEKGDSLSTIANSLVQAKLIKYPWTLILYSRLMGTESSFKVGIYRIKTNITMIDIHDYLIEGKQQLYRITIPEGWTSRQIADYLDSKNITTASDFISSVNSKEMITEFSLQGSSLEGFLYPDTYFFQKNYPANKIVRVMVETFFSRLEKIYPDFKELGTGELMKKVILASIVEREYRDPNEAALMAGVFYNRLSHSTPIPLGSCATIAYIITDIEGKPHPKIISYRDLKIQSPYNTYINNGLPPGPISNPGGIALKAAFFPESSDFLYFLLKNPESGQHEFTRNLSEHNAAYNLYIKKN